jgi:hypothetical protein
MSTKSQSESNLASNVELSENLSSNLVEIPSCRIEDIDMALFNLFKRDLPLLYTQNNDTKRVPIIFAGGERFALLARKIGLRDRSNALILPIISIMRTNVTQGNVNGSTINPISRHVIKKQLSHQDPLYQRLLNLPGFKNADDLVSPSSFLDSDNLQGALPGKIATRRNQGVLNSSEKYQNGNVLGPNTKNNFYEIYDIPAPTFVTCEYSVTIWTQFVQEMNNVLSAISSECHFKSVPSFKIETENGYWFVAYLDKDFSSSNNFEDYSEEERIIRSTFNIKVPGYLLGSHYIGAPNTIRKYISAPQISFETILSSNPPAIDSYGKIPSGNPGDFVLENLRPDDESLPGQSIGGSRRMIPNENESLIGSTSNAAGERFVIDDPFDKTKKSKKIITTKTSTTRQGETVYREIS